MTDSPKCAYYNEIRDIEFIIRPIEESVQAAIDGRCEMSKTYHCSQITKGKVDSAPALVSKDAICFYLVEPETGVVKERNHEPLASRWWQGAHHASGKGSSVVSWTAFIS